MEIHVNKSGGGEQFYGVASQREKEKTNEIQKVRAPLKQNKQNAKKIGAD